LSWLLSTRIRFSPYTHSNRSFLPLIGTTVLIDSLYLSSPHFLGPRRFLSRFFFSPSCYHLLTGLVPFLCLSSWTAPFLLLPGLKRPRLKHALGPPWALGFSRDPHLFPVITTMEYRHHVGLFRLSGVLLLAFGCLGCSFFSFLSSRPSVPPARSYAASFFLPRPPSVAKAEGVFF